MKSNKTVQKPSSKKFKNGLVVWWIKKKTKEALEEDTTKVLEN